MYFVSIADLCAAARTPVAFLNFIPLDIFRKNLYNRGITNQLDAWLTFLSLDDPEWIVKLIQSHHEFKPLYNEVYAICRNTEQIMGTFSEELKILDKNTVQLMIDEMQDEIDSQKNTIDSQKNTIDSQKMLLDQKEAEIARLQKLLKDPKHL